MDSNNNDHDETEYPQFYFIRTKETKITGEYFRCECGCNVFTKLDDYFYKCNGCSKHYETEIVPE